MRFRRRIPRRLMLAASEDALSYVLGLQGVPIPMSLAKEVLKIRRESRLIFVDWELRNWPEIYHLEIEKCVRLSYEGIEYYLPQVLVFDNTRRKIELSKVRFELDDTQFSLRNDVRALTQESFEKHRNFLRKKRRYSNEQNLRPTSIRDNDGLVLRLQPVRYEHFVHTNLVLDARSEQEAYTLREHLHSKGSLEEIDGSPLANHLGLNVLLFTADGKLIMQQRSREVAFFEGELCPAASGAVSIGDVPTDVTLQNMPKLREAFEEIGIHKEDVPAAGIRFLGLTRELIRGGKPEMFLFAPSGLSKEEILAKRKDARDKWESRKLVFFDFGPTVAGHLATVTAKHGFLLRFDEFIRKYSEQASIPLLTAVALWASYRTSPRLRDSANATAIDG